MDMSPPLEPWRPDPNTAVSEYRETVAIGEFADYKIRYEYDERDRMVEFAITQRRQLGGTWRIVAVYDICHDKGLHVHYHNRDGDEFAEVPINRVDSYGDLDEAFDFAIQAISTAWIDNERRSDRGR